MTTDQQRQAFEAMVRDRYLCHEYSFARSDDGYAHTVSHRAMQSTYASVQMLWEAYQAGAAQSARKEQP